jgi:hypothetical protein
MTGRGCRVGWAAAFVVVGLWAASPAWGEVGAPAATVQAVAADAQFLEYAPPPAAPGVVCLIDSGVDANPDTTPILAGSYAMAPGTSTDDELSKLNPPIEPGNHPDGHGTYMAMIMAAPVNGWGMVGIAPTSVKVFNLKALAAGQSTFSFYIYSDAIDHCLDGPVGVPGISVINLSLGSAAQPTAAELAAFDDAVAEARLQGFNVVAAAGNDGGAVAYPAAAPGVLAVGATDANPANLGVFCASSERGPALGLLAPGCGSQAEPSGGGNGLDLSFSDDGTPAWGSGTSYASAIVSAVLASMRAYAPGLSVEQAQDCLTSTAVNGGNLDAAAAFRACGLGAIVNQGLAAYSAATPPTPQSTTTPAGVGGVVVPKSPLVAKPAAGPSLSALRPRLIGVSLRGGKLIVRVATIPHGARLRVDVERRVSGDRYRTISSATVAGRTASLRVARWDRLAVLFLLGSERSATAYVHRPGAP